MPRRPRATCALHFSMPRITEMTISGRRNRASFLVVGRLLELRGQGGQQGSSGEAMLVCSVGRRVGHNPVTGLCRTSIYLKYILVSVWKLLLLVPLPYTVHLRTHATARRATAQQMRRSCIKISLVYCSCLCFRDLDKFKFELFSLINRLPSKFYWS